MAEMTIQIQDAPTTPLNLRFGVAYSPRVPTPPFEAYRALEVQADPTICAIEAYAHDGSTVEVFRGELADTFNRLCVHLRMDVTA